MPRASKQQARYAVGRCLMLWSSNDVTQQGSRPKTKLAIKGVKLKISLISAVSENGVIGSGPDIPWSVKGEQLLFKALTYNQWLLVGRKTFDSMGVLPNRKYAVVSKNGISSSNENVLVFPSIENALKELSKVTDHVYIPDLEKRLTMRCSTSRFAPWTAFKSRLCGFAAQKYSTKPQLKSCR